MSNIVTNLYIEPFIIKGFMNMSSYSLSDIHSLIELMFVTIVMFQVSIILIVSSIKAEVKRLKVSLNSSPDSPSHASDSPSCDSVLPPHPPSALGNEDTA